MLWLEDGRLSEQAALATDPVCGMAVEPQRAVTADWQGQTLSFCSRGCRDEFFEDPERFAAGEQAV